MRGNDGHYSHSDSRVYGLFGRHIVAISEGDYSERVIAELDRPVSNGVVVVEDSLYFCSGSHLLSCALH